MSTESCGKCKTKFKCEEINGDQPYRPTMEQIDCPNCKATVRSALTTGFFKTTAIPQKKQRR